MDEAVSVTTIIRDGRVVWEAAGKPVSVELSLDVMGRLGMAVSEGFRALRRRGLETGGLLIGTNRVEGDLVVVEIDDFEAIECDHATGPSYVLSEADRRRLEARIAVREGAGKEHSVVGFYRSHTRSGFAITAEDADVYSMYFGKAADVFLLIKSNDSAPPAGGFIIREGGEVLAPSPYVQFLFNQHSAKQPAAVIPGASLPRPSAPAQTAPVVPPRVPRRSVWVPEWPILLKAAGVAALAVGVWFGIRRRVPEEVPARDTLPLALKVSDTGGGLRLSWDHQTSRRANRAVLWIRDGKEEQRLELDSKQLTEGSVAYWPRSRDIDFRLQLLGPGSTTTESVRVIGEPSKPLIEVSAMAETAAGAPPAPVRSPTPRRRERIGKRSRPRSRVFESSEASGQATAAWAGLPDALAQQPGIETPVPTAGTEQQAEEIRSLAVSDAGTFHAQGRGLIQQGQFEEAIDRLSEAIRLDPTLARAYNARGYARIRLKRFQEAIAEFDEAIKLDPKYANAYHNRGSAKRAAGDKVGSEADFQKARELSRGMLRRSDQARSEIH
jgi:tetratricopeptide (TPR) repeat protein